MEINNKSRRRLLLGVNSIALGSIVGGLPTKWTRPIVDAVMLPIHATTTVASASVPCSAAGSWRVTDTRAGENDPGAPLVLNADHTGLYDQIDPVRWIANGDTITLSFAFNQSIADLTGTMNADCTQISGNWGNTNTSASGTWTATRSSATIKTRKSISLAKKLNRSFR